MTVLFLFVLLLLYFFAGYTNIHFFIMKFLSFVPNRVNLGDTVLLISAIIFHERDMAIDLIVKVTSIESLD